MIEISVLVTICIFLVGVVCYFLKKDPFNF